MPSSQPRNTKPQEIVYIVENTVSDAAKETVLDKVRKLIMRDAEDLSRKKAV